MGCKCRGAPDVLGHEQQKVFLELIDSGAGAKAYRTSLNMSVDKIRKHRIKIPIYRLAISAQDKIDQVKKLDKSPIEIVSMVVEIRAQLRRDIEALSV